MQANCRLNQLLINFGRRADVKRGNCAKFISAEIESWLFCHFRLGYNYQ